MKCLESSILDPGVTSKDELEQIFGKGAIIINDSDNSVLFFPFCKIVFTREITYYEGEYVPPRIPSKLSFWFLKCILMKEI
jgi:hypothetical protein